MSSTPSHLNSLEQSLSSEITSPLLVKKIKSSQEEHILQETNSDILLTYKSNCHTYPSGDNTTCTNEIAD